MKNKKTSATSEGSTSNHLIIEGKRQNKNSKNVKNFEEKEIKKLIILRDG